MRWAVGAVIALALILSFANAERNTAGIAEIWAFVAFICILALAMLAVIH